VAIGVGDTVSLPGDERAGQVIAVHVNPACLMRALVVRWSDGETEEIEEIEFGPLND